MSRNGQLCVWDCDTDMGGLLPVEEAEEEDDSGEEEEGDDEAEKKRQKGKLACYFSMLLLKLYVWRPNNRQMILYIDSLPNRSFCSFMV